MDKGIYCIENLINFRRYIGKTKNGFEERWQQHKRNLFNNKHVNKLLQEDYNEFGLDSFCFSVLEYTNDIDFKELDYIYSNNDLYNARSIKDEIVYCVAKHLKENNIKFKIDYKTDECKGSKLPLNWNIVIKREDNYIYITLKNMDYVNSDEEREKYKISLDNKIKFIESNSNYSMINQEYDFNSDSREIADLIINKI